MLKAAIPQNLASRRPLADKCHWPYRTRALYLLSCTGNTTLTDFLPPPFFLYRSAEPINLSRCKKVKESASVAFALAFIASASLPVCWQLPVLRALSEHLYQLGHATVEWYPPRQRRFIQSPYCKWHREGRIQILGGLHNHCQRFLCMEDRTLFSESWTAIAATGI